MCVCVCLSAPEATNYIHAYNYVKWSKFTMFRNIKKFYPWRGLNNEVHHERNQPNKSKVMPYNLLVSLEVWF